MPIVSASCFAPIGAACQWTSELRDGPDKGEAGGRGKQQQGFVWAKLFLNLFNGNGRLGDKRRISRELSGDQAIELLDLVRNGHGLGANGLFRLLVAHGARL